MPFDSGLRTGVKHGTRPRAAAKSSVSLAVKGLPLSDSHSTACGAWIVAKRNSTAYSIRSRTIEPLTPAPATACQASTSRGRRLKLAVVRRNQAGHPFPTPPPIPSTAETRTMRRLNDTGGGFEKQRIQIERNAKIV